MLPYCQRPVKFGVHKRTKQAWTKPAGHSTLLLRPAGFGPAGERSLLVCEVQLVKDGAESVSGCGKQLGAGKACRVPGDLEVGF